MLESGLITTVNKYSMHERFNPGHENRGSEDDTEHKAAQRHFDDIDNLAAYGLDGPLAEGQEGLADEAADRMISEAREGEFGAIFFEVSPKKRTLQTCDMVKDAIRKKETDLKLRVHRNDSLRSIEKGDLVLPEDYEAGDEFEGLVIADRIFKKESIEQKNDLYRYGDPVELEDGTYKYPELLPYFSSPGENNKEYLLRIYQFIKDAYYNLDKSESTMFSVITHAQVFHQFQNLSAVAYEIENKGLWPEPGTLPRVCWDMYRKYYSDSPPSYDTEIYKLNELLTERNMELIQQEIDYLHNLEESSQHE
jgi:hypothetical protein